MWRQLLLTLVMVAEVSAKKKRKFCKAPRVIKCIQAKIAVNPGRQRRMRGIMGGCATGGTPKMPVYDYDCIDNLLKKCDGASVDIFMTLYDQSVCMEMQDCEDACDGFLENTMLKSGVDCKGVRLLTQTMKELPAHCEATERSGRIGPENGAHFKQMLLSLLPAINDYYKLFLGMENFNMLDNAADLVFIDNEQMNLDPKTAHPMFGHFIGNEIQERTAGEASNYSFAPSPNDKMWVATPTIVEQGDFISLGEDPADMSQWTPMFVGDQALIVVYRNMQICNKTNGKCMLYKIGVFVATAKDIVDTSTTTGLVHYSPYAAPYSCLMGEDEEGYHCPEWVETTVYGTEHITVEEDGSVNIDDSVDVIDSSGELKEDEPDKGDL